MITLRGGGLRGEARSAILAGMENDTDRRTDPAGARRRSDVDEEEMARALLAAPGRFAVATHLRPDGDAFGSALGLCHALRAAGREAFPLGLGPAPETYDCLEGFGWNVPAEGFEPRPDDTLVVCDCGTPERLPAAVRPFAASMATLCIDHHEPGAGFPGPCLVRPAAASASEVVFDVLKRAGLPVGRAAAEALWVGIATDTGRFCYDATSPATMRAAAELLALGVRTQLLSECVYGAFPLRRLRLQKRLLGTLRTLAGGAVAVCSLSPEDYAAEGCDSADSENFVDVARAVRGVRLAAFVRKVRPDGKVNVSLRTKEPFDAAAICAEWEGGGHKRAAGATLAGGLDEILELVSARLARAAAEGAEAR